MKPDPAKDPFAASAQNLCEMVDICPLCGSSLAGHTFATLAEAGNKEDVLTLIRLFDSKEWEQLSHIRSFEVSRNAICAYAVTCPVGAGFAVAFISYVELYSHDELARPIQVLGATEWASLMLAFPNVDWHPI